MKNKDKRIEELRGMFARERRWTTFFIFVVFAFIVFNIINSIQIDRLENQLQSCQEEVDVWNLKVKCDWGNEDWVSIKDTNYTDFDSYKWSYDYFTKDKDCEIIK